MSANCTLALDERNTEVGFAITWWRLFTVRGRFGRVEGSLRLQNGDLESASLDIAVHTQSVSTNVALRDHHLQGPRFLDALAHPVIRFRSDAIHRVDGIIVVFGELVIRGIAQRVAARCPLEWMDAEGMGGMVSLESRVDVPLAPFGVGAVSKLQRWNPLYLAIGASAQVRIRILVPATRLLPALLPALGR
jgi:polyisoprenoid-binding protein YceI